LSEDGNEVFYIGIIDMLTAYDFKKKRERFLKTKILLKDAKGISVQAPSAYCERFIQCAKEITSQKNVES